MIQPSSTGYFGDRGDEILTDGSEAGTGYRADACKMWERGSAGVGETRRVITRFGLVLSGDGGFLPPMRFAALRFFIQNESTSGVYNVTAPEPCTNAEFMDALHRVTHLPARLDMRDWMVNAVLGKEQATVVMDSQRVIPERLTKAGFRFKYTDIEWALRQLLRGSGR